MIQWEGVRFIERGGLPRRGGVTSRAVCSKLTQMKSGVGMAGNALGRRARKLIVGMALLAFNLLVRARQREVTARMIEGRVLPVGWRVAGSAVRAEFPCVRVVAEVAGRAILRDRFHIRDRARVRMTVGTGNVRVLASERKCKRIMIEIRPVGIHAVMASQAVAAPTRLMRNGEVRVNLTMTGIASLQIELGHIVGVAIGAGERLARNGETVPAQRVADRLVREGRFIHLSQWSVRAAMFRMTTSARDILYRIHHFSVQGIRVLQFSRNLAMAIHTTVRHGLSLPGRGMTSLAVAASLRMRSDAAQRRSALRV